MNTTHIHLELKRGGASSCTSVMHLGSFSISIVAVNISTKAFKTVAISRGTGHGQESTAIRRD